MIHGTKLLDTDIELFAAALVQTDVYVWSMDEHDVYVKVDSGKITKYTPTHVHIRCSCPDSSDRVYPRDLNEFSVKF
ncbi:hypothetical protein ABNB59_05570 [Paenibacillus larvae]|uniref:Uncharacterized protein n=3 Tax=Paenibacillus larvae TaxID=1464 RepID=A0A2L1TMP8_9BACL|nr:hypothetical protein [Paenibacillus larvae]AQR77092.1 hypothetical protein BXP28_06705 [Paenibacillus larvae subsp. larvae]AQT86537.1 hypothetical protein B1222_22525 [Paenibacillus larvae subsp. pulvifaciens]AQZ48200.1 hypothetical protein B5S25_18085 [Paenibacillus larvae subsp. pulvifaciens]ARF66745.1 hypothetical protein B7C51_01340 [Paenibacillus larvae subsp. pulvifaciens]AVF21965.1 hypothetical protein ERICI_02108 [Paenibacillus larvae subsp. larvae]